MTRTRGRWRGTACGCNVRYCGALHSNPLLYNRTVPDESGCDTDQKCFFHVARIADSCHPNLVVWFQNVAFAHASVAQIPKQRFGEKFDEIFVDTGAARERSTSLMQYKEYCNIVGKSPAIDNSCPATSHFESRSTNSMGVVSAFFQIGRFWFLLDVHFVNADTPMLLLWLYGCFKNFSELF